VGLLNAPHGTKLYHRMKQEGRLLKSPTGDNTDFSLNFIPKMSPEVLLSGYNSILKTIYSPKHYYARVKTFLKGHHPARARSGSFRLNYVMAGFKSVVRLGIIGRERYQYWKLFFWSLFRRPRLFPLAITFAIYGFHFRRVFKKHEKAFRAGIVH
jgi:hypothetical protein